MKKISKMIIAIAAIAALSVFNGVTTSGTAQASSQMIDKTITNADVIEYLSDRGYLNITIVEVFTDGTRKCTSDLQGYWTYVYLNTAQTAIIGHEDIQF